MSRSLEDIRGHKFSRETLRSSFQNAISGQSSVAKSFSIALIATHIILAGGLAGLLGGFLTSSVVTTTKVELRVTFVSVVIALLVWIGATLYLGFVKGLQTTIATLAVAIIISIAIMQKFDGSVVLAILFFTLLALAMMFFSLLSGSLASAMIWADFPHNHREIKKVYAVFVIVIASISAYPAAFSLNNTSSLPNLIAYGVVPLIAGFLFGVGVVIFTLSATSVSERFSRHFNFFQTWAITFCTWGSTSFHNLNLSGVDFTGARLANTDLRARRFYRTCFKQVQGLERARVDDRYLDFGNPDVQHLLTQGYCRNHNFERVNLQGASLQQADLRRFNLLDANLNGADLRGADLRESILVRARMTDVDLSGADLTGSCIRDWSVNRETQFTGVRCDYIYRDYENDRPVDRYPVDRYFEPGEFEALFDRLSNVVELVFTQGVDWRALSFAFEKFQIEDNGLGLDLKGVEQRGDLWIAKVTHREGISRQQVEQKVTSIYADIRGALEVKDQQINQLLGIASNQAEAMREYSRQPFGNNFFISGSQITNLAGSGEIRYEEASQQIRGIVAGGDTPNRVSSAQHFLKQLQQQNITTLDEQVELIQQVLIKEASEDAAFRRALLEQEQNLNATLPPQAIAIAIEQAITQLRAEPEPSC